MDRPKAVLYARVSTAEQVDGYSIRQQLAALADWCEANSYDVLEEVVDEGLSAAYMDRPGLDRALELVRAGGVAVVLAQDADRITREPMHRMILDEECVKRGARLLALDDWGDDSHEGQLLRYIKNWQSKGERLKTAERTRRGAKRKVSEGKILGSSPKPRFGFAHLEDGRGKNVGYAIDPLAMPVVLRVFAMVAAGHGVRATGRALDSDNVPPPRGGAEWSRRTLREMVLDDVYRPHEVRELEGLVPADVIAKLDPTKLYGVSYHGRVRVRRVSNSERVRENPGPETWIGVPVDLTGSGLERSVVDGARRCVAGNRATPKVGDRVFPLAGGVMRCGNCGRTMAAYGRVNAGGKERRFYYRCNGPSRTGGACGNRKSHRAAELEDRAWETVCSSFDPEGEFLSRLEAEYRRERQKLVGGSAERRAALMAALAKLTTKRETAYDLAIDGTLPKDALQDRLATLDDDEKTLRGELATVAEVAERLEALDGAHEAVLEMVNTRFPGGAPEPEHEDPDTTYERGEGESVTTTVETWGHTIPDHSYTAVVNKVALDEPPEARRRRYLRAGVAFTLDADGTLIATWAVGSPVANGWRTHGNELWEFDDEGYMRRRDASINDYKIDESERKFR